MLTLEKIKEYWIPKNTSRVNNLVPSQKSIVPYNDSLNVYEAVEFIIDELFPSGVGTNLDATQPLTTVVISSDTGDDATILSASSTRAGVMTAEDFNLLHAIDSWSGLGGASDLGTFTGTTISNNTDMKTALQELETYAESITTAIDGLPELITLTGVAVNSTDLGSFTGTIISDSVDIKTALQELETEVDSLILSGGSDGNGIYTGSGTIDVSGSGVTVLMSTDNGYFYIQYSNGQEGLTLYNNTNNTGGWAQIASQDGNSYVYTDNTGVNLEAGAGALILGSSSNTFEDYRGSGLTSGIEYVSDYSLGFTDRTLIDKAYVDGQISTVSSDISDVANDVANLVTLTGVAVDSTDLGTFTGVTIADNVTIKQALQTLETNLELVSGGGSGTTNLSTTYTSSTFTVTSDTGTNALVAASTTSNAGAMTAADRINLDALVVLSGTTGGDEDLGTFTGTTISDNVTIKDALQELETAVEGFSAASGLPSGTDTQTIRYNGTTQEASSVLVNDGVTVAINTSPSASFDLTTDGAIQTIAGIVRIQGTGDATSTLTASGLRMENTTGGTGNTWNVESADTGELNFYGGSADPYITFDSDGRIYINDVDHNTPNSFLYVASTLDAPSTNDALTLSYYPSNDAAFIRFIDEAAIEVGAVHAEGGNLEIEVPSIFTITSGTEGFNFNGTGNFILPNQASDPGSPAEGSLWYNGTTTRFTVDNGGTEQLAYVSDITSAGDYEVVSATTYTVADYNTVYFRAYSNSIAVTLDSNMNEGQVYYFYSKADASYTITFSIDASYTWWIVGNINEDLTSATTLSIDSTDKNSYAVAQRRGTRIFIHFLTY